MKGTSLMTGVLLAIATSGTLARADLAVEPAKLTRSSVGADSLMHVRYEIVNRSVRPCPVSTSIHITSDRGAVIFASPWSEATLDSAERRAWHWAGRFLPPTVDVADARRLHLSVWVRVGTREFVVGRQELRRIENAATALFLWSPASPRDDVRGPDAIASIVAVPEALPTSKTRSPW